MRRAFAKWEPRAPEIPGPLGGCSHTRTPVSRQGLTRLVTGGVAESDLTPYHKLLKCLPGAHFFNLGCLPGYWIVRQAGGHGGVENSNYACLPPAVLPCAEATLIINLTLLLLLPGRAGRRRMWVAHFQPYLTTAFSRRACGHANADSDPERLSGWPSACYQGILCQLCLRRHSLSTLPYCCCCLGGQEGGGWA